MDLVTLLAISTAPGACIVLYIYIKDKHEKEPIGLLVKSFVFGAVAVLVTWMISFPLENFVPKDETDIYQQAIHAFIFVALVEEFSKFLFVRGILYNDDHFNEPFDGIVYSVTVSMGFATLENVFYVSEGGYATAIVRMFTAVPAHATFAVLMGYFIGRAKFAKSGTYNSLVGLLAATAFHGAYDYFWFISFVPGIWFGAIVSLVVGVWLSRKAIRAHQDASPFRAGLEAPPVLPPETKNPGSDGQGFS